MTVRFGLDDELRGVLMDRDERDLIKARRKAIKASAPCEGCGASLAACKAERGKDQTAPSWFGCCARGLDMRPCRHVPDRRALQNLLKEIESGRVRSPEEMLLDSIEEFPARRRRGVLALLVRFDETDPYEIDYPEWTLG